ncbi:MAG: polysaccharide deacetylase family protein [Spirochaetes bacterium]|jgi:peptidoglycan/xylan/chitin deacetylase (PgdA/CDA1 family)|nr:polysaccharide deacetylase family protein [Spirochaetota bacterium]
MHQRSRISTFHAALLALLGTVALSGWISFPGKASLETLVQPLKHRCHGTIVLYRARIAQYHALFMGKVKTGSYGRAMSEGDVPVFTETRDAEGKIKLEEPVTAESAYRPGSEMPPPESPLVKRKPPTVIIETARQTPDPGKPRQKLPERKTHPAIVRKPVPARMEGLPPVKPMVWKHGSRDRPRVALSFDSGETNAGRDGCNRLIDHLVATGTPATFFLTGRFAESYPDLTRRLGSVRHFELGNHSHTHPDLTGRSSESVANEIMRAQRVIHRLTGRQGRLFRPPFGKIDPVVKQVVAMNGLQTILWDVAADDYRKDVTGEQVKRAVLGGVRNGSIILLHMHGNGSASCDALPSIISGLRSRGFELVMVSSLIGDKALE